MSSIASPTAMNKTAIRHHHWQVTRRKLGEQMVSRIFLIAVSALYMLPLYWMFVTALKPDAELSVFPPELWPGNVQWENFARAVGTFPFWTYFVNTVIITAGVMIGHVLSNLFVAYGFSCIRWPGRDRIFYVVLATIFIPFPVALVPLFDLFASLHWVNTFLPLIVPSFFASSFYVFLFRQFLLQLPGDLLDAARIDGATELQIFARIVLPLSLPAIAVVALLSGLGAWNDFVLPLIYLQDDNLRTLSIGLETFRTVNSQDVQFNLLMAASVLVILPIIIIFLAFQRFFIRGVVMGSIQ